MFSDEKVNEIINLYQNNMTAKSIAKLFGCGQTSIIKCLKKNNIARRPTSIYNRKYNINYDFFKEINCEANAYFLGFMYADGNNYINKTHSYEVNLTFHQQDHYILEVFRKHLSPNSPIKIIIDKHTNNKRSVFKLNSKFLSKQLIDLGCVPNKSLILKFPDFIPEYLLHHFVRGYFDGDGSIYSKKPTKSGYINYGFQITSTDKFCLKVKEIIFNKFNINCYYKMSCPKTNQITHTLSVGGNLQVMKVLDWLYQDATIYLPRKYNKYIEFKKNKAGNIANLI